MVNKMENKMAVLDGKTNGFIIYLKDRKSFMLKNGSPRLFKNLELAKTFCSVIYKKFTPLEYKIFLYVDGKSIDFDYVSKREDHYEVYTLSGKYYVFESVENRVTNLGYYVFEKGDTERCDKKYGEKRSKELYRNIRHTISDIFRYINIDPSIESITKEDGHLVVNIKDSTAKIHFLYNSEIMDLNQARKEENKRCLPYDKAMDKYTTIYSYATVDNSEPEGFGSKEKINKMIDYIIDYLKDSYSDIDPHYVPVEFKGIITL